MTYKYQSSLQLIKIYQNGVKKDITIPFKYGFIRTWKLIFKLSISNTGQEHSHRSCNDKISDDYDQFQNTMLFRSRVSHETWLLLIILLKLSQREAKKPEHVKIEGYQ